MLVLGINCFHANSSVCFVENGQVIYAMEEERINRIKNSSGFPVLALENGLNFINKSIDDFDFIAVNNNPSSNLYSKLKFAFKNIINVPNYFHRFFFKNRNKKFNNFIKEYFPNVNLSKKLIYVEHHLSHAISSYYLSGFENATSVSIDGSGDFKTTALFDCDKNDLKLLKKIDYPNSLGILYTSLTKFLGFNNYGDEYKVMGLSSYGDNSLVNKLSNLISDIDGFKFQLNLKYFNGLEKMNFMSLKNNSVIIDDLLNENFENLIGFTKRELNQKLEKKHLNLAYAIQKIFETQYFSILNSSYQITKNKNLCLSGGCAMNSLANGKIKENTPYKNIFIQPAAIDSGGAIGAALYAEQSKDKNFKRHKLKNIYLGLNYENKIIDETLNILKDKNSIEVKRYFRKEDTYEVLIEMLTSKKIIGLYQGRMEWGSRSLGNRSIIADPRFHDMKDIINKKIKLRENFRPFAPTILEEEVGNWFEYDTPSPYMMEVRKFRDDKKKKIPSVVHIDGTGRLQTINEQQNYYFYNLIKKFFQKTDVPMLINTSFNENEPVVLTPKQALDTFLRTDMDAMLLENFILKKQKK